MGRLWPVSVKGVVLDGGGRVLLLRNDRREWELPGGRLEAAEVPEECVVREIFEESGWKAEAGPLLDVWVYEPLPGAKVLIVTYGCRLTEPGAAPEVSHEHEEIGLFTPAEAEALTMPEGYKRSIRAWHHRLTPSG